MMLPITTATKFIMANLTHSFLTAKIHVSLMFAVQGSSK